ncbi:hypothetical protein MLD38_019920 [Melastoma candidum]|uniref:Uncharacterized protein n=1 Tax=Melastoma candidum TaxID=119954 RepID=A0ACB9QJ98_9MYRT|nr:hypothetical protein MLD38_019920 [Melastoma candidum]
MVFFCQNLFKKTRVALKHTPRLWAVDNSAPANYLLISGDRDFSNALHQLRLRRYNILLAQPTQASAALVAAAKTVWLWTTLAGGGAPLNSNDKSQLASNYEQPVADRAPAAPDAMPMRPIRCNYSLLQTLCYSNDSPHDNYAHNKPIETSMVRSTSLPIVRPDKIQDKFFQRESIERKHFNTAPHEFFGAGSSSKLNTKPLSETPDFFAGNGHPQCVCE